MIIHSPKRIEKIIYEIIKETKSIKKEDLYIQMPENCDFEHATFDSILKHLIDQNMIKESIKKNESEEEYFYELSTEEKINCTITDCAICNYSYERPKKKKNMNVTPKSDLTPFLKKDENGEFICGKFDLSFFRDEITT